jgi:hypothetical protein
MVDIDLGEMFLNFPLHEMLQKYSGVDLSHYAAALHNFMAGPTKKNWVHWTRCWMGLKPSPFMAIMFYYWAEEFARGNRREKNNPLRWEFVKLNLPGDPRYDPTLPRVMKWDRAIENIVGDLVAFVDDLRASGHSVEQTWAIARQVVARLQYLGLQDAPRKSSVIGLSEGLLQGWKGRGVVEEARLGKGCWSGSALFFWRWPKGEQRQCARDGMPI